MNGINEEEKMWYVSEKLNDKEVADILRFVFKNIGPIEITIQEMFMLDPWRLHGIYERQIERVLVFMGAEMKSNKHYCLSTPDVDKKKTEAVRTILETWRSNKDEEFAKAERRKAQKKKEDENKKILERKKSAQKASSKKIVDDFEKRALKEARSKTKNFLYIYHPSPKMKKVVKFVQDIFEIHDNEIQAYPMEGDPSSCDLFLDGKNIGMITGKGNYSDVTINRMAMRKFFKVEST